MSELEDFKKRHDASQDFMADFAREASKRFGHQPTAYALMGMAAHHSIHSHAEKEDFLRACAVAWDKSFEFHEKLCP